MVQLCFCDFHASYGWLVTISVNINPYYPVSYNFIIYLTLFSSLLKIPLQSINNMKAALMCASRVSGKSHSLSIGLQVQFLPVQIYKVSKQSIKLTNNQHKVRKYLQNLLKSGQIFGGNPGRIPREISKKITSSVLHGKRRKLIGFFEKNISGKIRERLSCGGTLEYKNCREIHE